MPLTIIKQGDLCGIGGVVEALTDYLPVGEIAFAYSEEDDPTDQLWVVGYGNTDNQDVEDFNIDLQFFYNPYVSKNILQAIKSIAVAGDYYLGLVQLIRYTINGIPELYVRCPQIETFAHNNIHGLTGVDNEHFLIHTWPVDTDQDDWAIDEDEDSPISSCPWYAYWERRHGPVTSESLCLFPQTYGGIVKMHPNAWHAPFTYRCATINETLTLHPQFKQDDFDAVFDQLRMYVSQEKIPLVECCPCKQNPSVPCRPDMKIPIRVSEEGCEIPGIPCKLCLPAAEGKLQPLCGFKIPEPLRDYVETLDGYQLQLIRWLSPSFSQPALFPQKIERLNNFILFPLDDPEKYVSDIILDGCIPYILARTGLVPIYSEIVSQGVLRLVHEPVSDNPDDPEAYERTETYFMLHYHGDDLVVIVIPDIAQLMQYCYIVESNPAPIAPDQDLTAGKVEYGMEIYTYPLLYCPQSQGRQYFLIDEGVFTRVTKFGDFSTGEFGPVEINAGFPSDQIPARAHQCYTKSQELVDVYINRPKEE